MIRKLLIILLFITGSTSLAHGQTYILGPVQFATAACSDADATAYCTAAGITDPTAKTAICNFAVREKAASRWGTEVQGFYILSNGSFASCKYNLINTALYTLTESGTITYSTGSGGGAHGDGGSALNAHYVVSSNSVSINSLHFMLYNQNNITEASTDIGNTTTGNADIELYSGVMYSAMNTSYAGGTYLSASISTSKGFFLTNRTSATAVEIRQDNTSLATGSISATNQPDGDVKILTSNSANFSTKTVVVASFGAGISNPTDYYNSVHQLLSDLGLL